MSAAIGCDAKVFDARPHQQHTVMIQFLQKALPINTVSCDASCVRIAAPDLHHLAECHVNRHRLVQHVPNTFWFALCVFSFGSIRARPERRGRLRDIMKQGI